jgi:hypothetical protein
MTAKRKTTKKATPAQPTDADRKQYGRIVLELCAIPATSDDVPEWAIDEARALKFKLSKTPFAPELYQCDLASWVDHIEDGAMFRVYKEVWVLK